MATKVIRFSEEQLDSLNKVLDYLRAEEQNHYEEEPIEGHVYEHILAVDEALGQ